MSYLNSCSDIDPRDFRGFVDLSATAAIRGAPPGGIYTLRELLQFVVAASWEKPMAENWNAVTTLRPVATATIGFVVAFALHAIDHAGWRHHRRQSWSAERPGD